MEEKTATSCFSINGFGEAADAYFKKDVTNLTLPESAFLAGLIRSPNRYNPYHDIGTATARRNQVLDNMAETGAISSEEANEAKQTPLEVAAGSLEHRLVIEVRMGRGNDIADAVVLLHEQRLQHAQPQPESRCHTKW